MWKSLLLISAAVLFPPVLEAQSVKFPDKLANSLRQGYLQSYVAAPKHKAFALTPDHQNAAAVYGHETADEAARVASARCLAEHGIPCRLWLVGDEDVLASYGAAAKASSAALARLPSDREGQFYGQEAEDFGVDAPSGLRAGSAIHGATPIAAPAGTRRITTAELLKLYKSQPKLVVLDTLHSKAIKRSTLPLTTWLYGAGWEQEGVDALIDRNLRKVMKTLAPRKDAAIVTYCSSKDCWLSWNAALRLKQAGYTRVYWYRGGIEAWKQAGLPLVETPLTAYLW